MGRVHELKILPEYYWKVKSGLKNFEVRKDDRGFKEGDKLILKEWKDGKFTGEQVERWIGYIFKDTEGMFGMPEDVAILGLKRSAPLKHLDGDF